MVIVENRGYDASFSLDVGRLLLRVWISAPRKPRPVLQVSDSLPNTSTTDANFEAIPETTFNDEDSVVNTSSTIVVSPWEICAEETASLRLVALRKYFNSG